MKTSISTTRKHAYVVRLSDLEKLYKLLEDRVGTVTVSARCSDDMVREFDTWEEIASYDNPPSKKIIGLSVKSYNYNMEESVYIEYHDESYSDVYSSNMSIDIKGEEKFCLDMKNNILEIVEQIKPWYSFLSYKNFSIMFVSYIFVYLLVRYFIYDNIINIYIKIDNVLIYVSIIVSMTFFVLVVLAWLRSLFFPSSYFALGHGKERYKIADRVRWGIIISLAVSFVAPLLIALAS